ncbi:MAG TPA: hypothetical protein PKI05_07125 [Thermogutta sp.]|nr:hypothetical protein [Thermogutta sp.]
MGTGLKRATKSIPATVGQGLPSHWRTLYICDRSRTGAWLVESFAAESPAEVEVHEAPGRTAGLARLRDEIFDVIFIVHDPPELDAIDLTVAYRTGGTDEALIVLGRQSEQELAVPCYEAGADGYVCVSTATSHVLKWTALRAVQRCHLTRQNRRFQQSELQRLQREREEALRVLLHQKHLISDSSSEPSTRCCGPLRTTSQRPSDDSSCDHLSQFELPEPPDLPAKLIAHYRELLRAYIIMGSGHLGIELRELADVFATAGLSPKEVLHLHLYVAAELIRGLGSRSTRHVITRTNLLIMEVLLQLAEAYRSRYRDASRPPIQLFFPQFEQCMRDITASRPTIPDESC